MTSTGDKYVVIKNHDSIKMSSHRYLLTDSSSSFPCYPGAYLLNGTQNTTANWSMFPIYQSISNYSTLGISAVDTYYYVMPGYKLEVYTAANYAALNTTVNNSTGITPLYQSMSTPNSGQSCILYYNNAVVSNTNITLPSSISKTGGTLSGSTFNTLYNIYTFTASGSLSIANASGVTLNIMAVAGGGGGAGGMSYGAWIYAGGGGGEVTFKQVTITGNDTITVNIGSGGAGGSELATTQHGKKGGNTSLTFSTNTSFNFTCNGGGGGISGRDATVTFTPSDASGGSSGGISNSYTIINPTLTAGGYGNSGGIGTSLNGNAGGGGGGANANGSNGNIQTSNFKGGNGGDGINCSNSYTTIAGIHTALNTAWYFGAGGGGGAMGTGIDANCIVTGGNGGKGGGGGGSIRPNGATGTKTVGTGGTNGYNGSTGNNGSNETQVANSGNAAANSGSGGGCSITQGGNGSNGIVFITVLKTAASTQV